MAFVGENPLDEYHVWDAGNAGDRGPVTPQLLLKYLPGPEDLFLRSPASALQNQIAGVAQAADYSFGDGDCQQRIVKKFSGGRPARP